MRAVFPFLFQRHGSRGDSGGVGGRGGEDEGSRPQRASRADVRLGYVSVWFLRRDDSRPSSRLPARLSLRRRGLVSIPA